MPAGLDGNPHPISTDARDAVVGRVVDRIDALQGRPRLVAIDGASGSGKSTFADEVARALVERRSVGDVDVVRASVDSFHNPRSVRYRRGKASAEGYYRDSHDLDALQLLLLEPFRRTTGTFRVAAFDEPTDRPVDAVTSPPRRVEPSMVLVFDGIFALRPELVDYWDMSVFLEAPRRREEAWVDYLERDLPSDPMARAEEVARRRTVARRERYVDGHAMYVVEAAPRERADIVIDNDDLRAPVIVTDRGEERR